MNAKENLEPARTRPTPPPVPPYYAVVFVSTRPRRARDGEDDGYATTAARMVELAQNMPGFLGMDSVRDAAGLGITVSYWRDARAIDNWKENAEHLDAQRRGRAGWYEDFTLHIARVERTCRGPA
ncbi:antibiotic biosynthesis monooxygenase family protein [Varunaivibrio sulfuroxidans]|uniref:Heme-degrading monooxygenase HmoA n=1 Tax=Varunaivibrio sulfuroxidans TaxID=1773489 RepID=A0A4R3JEH5_9PROT|nr:antibiotic biosynthesis monooxygenase [Varunaivibrio sulfuroxidans]TCS64197.1 heme-degrading monooxygenase HmoA [Varunaivibrio sulfuroxidans]WES31358.1 antibiotic biosynthesis monooxygenase [Varunaivibrio sulfuroxidans]